ncbi:MAG TPA: zinc-ribbon domain-containing protein [Pyrinomonadaceae bacterium]|nr:zinc-ribbon domain-containing protein [Pyrinomonadaceae bacterium]
MRTPEPSISEPEIARRCPHCGISLRQNASFCPQCGEKIDDQIRDTLTPATTNKTGVAENVHERVGKIKHVSSVVIDQAASDPSLRFVLVAAGLFVLFLVLLILSKVIG